MTSDLHEQIRDLLVLAREAQPAENKLCSHLTVDEDLALMRFYRAVKPSCVIAILEGVAVRETEAREQETSR